MQGPNMYNLLGTRAGYNNFLKEFREKYNIIDTAQPSSFYLFDVPHPKLNTGIQQAFYQELQKYNEDPNIYEDHTSNGLTDEQIFKSIDGESLVETLESMSKQKMR